MDADAAPARERWSEVNYQLAAIQDAVSELILTTAYRGSKKRPPKVKPARRPTDTLMAMVNARKSRADAIAAFRGMIQDKFGGSL